MKSCKTRLLLAKSKTSPETAIGVQKSASGLAFLDTYNGVLAHQYVDAKHDGAKPKLSQFFYKDDGYPFDPQIVVIAGGLPKSEWFFKDPFVRLNTCGTSNLTMEGTSDISALEEEIINGGMTAIEQTPYVWEYEKALFDKLDTRSELRVGFPAREAFYNAKAATSLPSFVAVGKGIDNLFVLSNEDQLQLNNLHTQLEEAQALYNSYLTQGLMTFEDEPWTEAAIAGLSEHTQSIANFEEQIATKWLAIKATQQARATELLAANEQLNAVKVYEQATKKWQELYLKAFLNQGLANENDLAELRLLAGTCPSVVGSTVYYSRMLLPSCEQANFDDSACGNAGNGSKVVKNTTVASVLYPNPANDEVSIRLTTMQPLNVIIIDINGRVMTSQATNGNATVVINTSQYPNGIYTIQYSDATIAVQKLIIQH
jgi:hypothetical protein